MFKRIANLIRRNTPFDGREGLVYVSRDSDEPMLGASPGAVISVPGRGPPWIVVDLDAASVVVARWPGRLWRVRIMEAATDADQAKVGGAPLPYVRYVRAISVLVLDEEEAATLFGSHGGEILPVFDAAMMLTPDQAEALHANRHPKAPAAYDRAWRTWLNRYGKESDTADLDGALNVGGGAPTNHGLSVVHGLVFDRACLVDPAGSTDTDDEEVWLNPPWEGAADALGDAVMALGAPDLLDEEDRAALLHGWTVVFGRPGPNP